MDTVDESLPGYRGITAGLAVAVILAAVVSLLEPEVVFGSAGASSLWPPVVLLLTGLLAGAVLSRVLAHGLRLVATHVGSADRSKPHDSTLPRILGSVVLGTIATYTFGWVVGSVYALYFADESGVLLAPVVTVVVGSVLAVLVLVEPTVYRLVDGPGR